MPQPFPAWMNRVSRWGPPLAVLFGMLLATLSALGMRSSYNTGVGVEIEQPVPFSHRHHVKGLGLDCRFCHTKVERGAFAGMPDTHTCMGCHAHIWPNAPILAPARESQARQIPLRWNRVNRLPDHVYFDHSIHVNKGVGCVTCHGRLSEMALTAKQRPFFMYECLDCHRHPDPNLRPLEEIYNEDWQSTREAGAALRKFYGIRPDSLIQCSVCHR